MLLSDTESDYGETLVARDSDAACLDELRDTFFYSVIRQTGRIGDCFHTSDGRARIDSDAVAAVAPMSGCHS